MASQTKCLPPDITDDPENVAAVCEVAAALPHLAGVDLLPYHSIGAGKYRRLDRQYRLLHTDAPTRRRMDEIASTMAAAGLPVGTDGLR